MRIVHVHWHSFFFCSHQESVANLPAKKNVSRVFNLLSKIGNQLTADQEAESVIHPHGVHYQFSKQQQQQQQ